MASTTPIVPPRPATVTPPVVPEKKEDDVEGEGEAIDTFSTYVPTALPQSLLAAIVATKDDISDDTVEEAKKPAASTDHMQNKVIEILDSDDEEPSKDTAASTPKDTAASLCSKSEEDDSSTPELTNSIFDKIPSHTFPACESALLASVAAPTASGESAECLIKLAKNKVLSPLQLEGAALAITRHQRIFRCAPSVANNHSNKSYRSGFFLGDGAGIGKGRQIAAVLADSLFRGRTRHLWISASRDLHLDAKRDLNDVGCINCPVHQANDVLGKNKTSSSNRGVLFVTYALLVSGQGKRMEEIISWLATGSSLKQKDAIEAARSFSGVIVFDEAHKAKNLQVADTQTAQRVVALQERLPMARILYCSATGVSDLSHLVYANRLGLWGPGSGTLYPTFESFSQALNRNGNGSMGALELLACEMKQAGMFVARTLSWEGAEFETLEVPLSFEQRSVYDEAVKWWVNLQKEVQNALNIISSSSQSQGQTNIWKNYWAAHLRFFREMNVCAKIPRVANEAKEYLENGHAIVIGLQSTGEASTQVALEDWGEQHNVTVGDGKSCERDNSIDATDVLLPSLLSTARSTMIGFVKRHFPVACTPPSPPNVPPLPPNGFATETERLVYMKLQAEAEHIKSLPPPPLIPELLERRCQILAQARQLPLPPNPLDDLIERLGGVDEVAELTGRSGRIVRYPQKDPNKRTRYHYVKRADPVSSSKTFGLSMPTGKDEMCDRLNIVEKKKFMDGRKSIAVISDAASTGISLHASVDSKAAHKRRVHFTIELPWAADSATQQLGRSHRSGQVSAPIYKNCVTELGGERRFGAAVAKRMASLGALTKGDRRAATGSDLSEFDVDSAYGRRALARLCLCVRDCDPKNVGAPSRESNAILDKYFLDEVGTGQNPSHQQQNNQGRRMHALFVARDAFSDVGLGSDESSTKDGDVRVFLNRIAGLPVLKQNLLFSLFHSTLQDLVAAAKSKGEYEGCAEAVNGTSIELEMEPTLISVDVRSRAQTKLNRLVVDRGISFEMAVEISENGAIGRNTSQIQNGAADSGFYVSKRFFAGRKLVLFAKRKVEPEVDDEDNAVSSQDPLRLMIITRPNTGTAGAEMPSKDLLFKYSLVVSSVDLRAMLSESQESHKTGNIDVAAKTALARSRYSMLAQLWDGAYRDSDIFESSSGIASRKSRVGLATGAVLHVLPALEKAVAGEMLAKDRALRVARAELTNSGERLVGIRFPLNDEPINKLQAVLAQLEDARKCCAGGKNEELFYDEDYAPVDEKTMSWATRERTTMRTFFSSLPSSDKPFASGNKRKGVSSSSSSSRGTKAHKESPKDSKRSRRQSDFKKPSSSIRAFFSEK